MTTPATEERHRFADELLRVGAGADTLCDGWSALDLAAHVVLRDRRPDAAAGLVIGPLAGHTERVQDRLAARGLGPLVELVRSGPPIWSLTRLDRVDRMVNTAEFFVHLEDVRRAQADWTPRDLDPDLLVDLAASLRRAATTFAKKAPVGITLAPDDGSDPIVAHDGEPMVTVRGPVGELVLWIFGRQAHALVTYEGPADAVAAASTARFGI